MLSISLQRQSFRFLCARQNPCPLPWVVYSRNLSDGPMRLYQSYLEKRVLAPDHSQLQAVSRLQSLYDQLQQCDTLKNTGIVDDVYLYL